MNARVLAAALLALAPASAGASAGRPALALTASPSHVTLAGAASATIRVANPGSSPLLVEAAPAGFALSLRGRPRVLLAGASARRAAAWLTVRPSRVVLAAGGGSTLRLAASPRQGAAPGDHPAVVVLTAQTSRGAGVAVRMRIGITVVVRVAGRTRHRLAVRSLQVRRTAHGSVVRLVVGNDGNVVERLPRGGLRVSLLSGGHVVAELRSRSRDLLPDSRALFELPYPAWLRGRVTARVAVGGMPRPRAFQLQL